MSVTSVGPGLDGLRIATEIQSATAGLLKDALEAEGQAALKLIQSASIDPQVGGQLDINA